MMSRRILRLASRLVVCTMVFAHALIAAQAYATVPGSARIETEQMAPDGEPCHEAAIAAAPSPKSLLCKHHCLSALQTLDHPLVELAAPGLALVLPLPETCWKPLVEAVLQSSAIPHAGAPPALMLTARLRI